MSELSDEQKGILKALTELTEPAGCKVIGEQAGIPWRTVMGKLLGLRKDGYVENPVKGKYVATDKGREVRARDNLILHIGVVPDRWASSRR